jgi:hypothetical protein
MVAAGLAGKPAVARLPVQIVARREISRATIEHSTFNAELPSFPASATWMLDAGG